MRWAWILVLASCIQPVDRRPLAELGDTRVDVIADNRAGLALVAFDTPGCAAFDGAHAALDNQPFTLEDPRVEQGTCVLGGDQAALAPDASTASTHVLVVSDATATWRIEFGGVDPDDLAFTGPLVAGQTATLTWPHGPPILNGCYRLTSPDDWSLHACRLDPGIRFPPQTTGNTVEIDLESDAPAEGELELDMVGRWELGPASARGAALPRCDGPAHCSIEIESTSDREVTVSHPPA